MNGKVQRLQQKQNNSQLRRHRVNMLISPPKLAYTYIQHNTNENVQRAHSGKKRSDPGIQGSPGIREVPQRTVWIMGGGMVITHFRLFSEAPVRKTVGYGHRAWVQGTGTPAHSKDLTRPDKNPEDAHEKDRQHDKWHDNVLLGIKILHVFLIHHTKESNSWEIALMERQRQTDRGNLRAGL